MFTSTVHPIVKDTNAIVTKPQQLNAENQELPLTTVNVISFPSSSAGRSLVTANNDDDDAFEGEQFVDRNALVDSLSPLLHRMKMFGLYFVPDIDEHRHSRTGTARTDTHDGTQLDTKFKKNNVFRWISYDN